MFNYFIPGVSKEQLAPNSELDRDLLRKFGLDETLTDVKKVPAHAAVANVTHGPDGQAGVVIAPVSKHKGTPAVTYDPRLQKWEPVATRYWIGALRQYFTRQERPSPEDLERWELVGGFDVPDANGQAWNIPIGRAAHHGSEFGHLPQSFTIDPDTGEVKEHLLDSYTWLWELSGQIRDWYFKSVPPPAEASPEEKAAFDPPHFNALVKMAAKLLGVNYRIGTAELAALHKMGVPLLTQNSVHAFARASFGWEVLEQAKKNATANGSPPAVNSSPSTTGESTPDAPPAIDPPAGPSKPL
jgi:hypothetical protein